MHPNLLARLASVRERQEELNGLLALPETAENPSLLQKYAQEHGQISPIVAALDELERLQREQAALADLADDPEMAELIASERDELAEKIRSADDALARLMLPKDPLDEADVYLEIRAGTGGDEAALFAGDLFRMYSRYAELRRWQLAIISENPGEHGRT